MPYAKRRRLILFPRYCLPVMIFVLILFLFIMPVSAFKDPCPMDKQDTIAQYYINELQLCKDTDDGSPACLKNREDSKRYICQLAAQGYCYDCDPQECSKYGIVCKGSSPPPPPERDNTWIVVVGAIGVLGAGAVAGVKILGSKKPAPETPGKGSETEKKEKKKKESVTYILQLSASHLSVTSEQPASLSVAVWKKEGDKPPVPEPGAVVTVVNPPGSGLSVTPSTGNSPLQTQIAQTGDTKEPSVVLGINATAGGTTKKAEITVDVSSRTKIEFE
jgi:hypothetical protein